MVVDRAKRTQNVTIKDVAQEAGVSYATVSRVLNHNKHVRPEKRQRVLDAITRLGYVVNQQARSLAGGNSQVIGLVAPNLAAGYMVEVLSGIDAELSTAPYDLMLYTTQHRKTKEAIYAQTLTRGLTDGLLLLLPLNPGAYLETLHAQKFPYVVIDNQGFDDFSPTVVGTNWQGAYDATHYLIKLGHRRIGFIAGMPGLISAAERLSGYKAALQTYGIAFDPQLVANGNFNQPEG
ncbi:MAG: LacI family transcriptional regulator, partial [Anaerolineae bacterium]|nr:LacI family transcriptional regulator [Anaerolineae bacterium]